LFAITLDSGNRVKPPARDIRGVRRQPAVTARTVSGLSKGRGRLDNKSDERPLTPRLHYISIYCEIRGDVVDWGRLKMQDLTIADQTALLHCWTSCNYDYSYVSVLEGEHPTL